MQQASNNNVWGTPVPLRYLTPYARVKWGDWWTMMQNSMFSRLNLQKRKRRSETAKSRREKLMLGNGALISLLLWCIRIWKQETSDHRYTTSSGSMVWLLSLASPVIITEGYAQEIWFINFCTAFLFENLHLTAGVPIPGRIFRCCFQSIKQWVFSRDLE